MTAVAEASGERRGRDGETARDMRARQGAGRSTLARRIVVFNLSAILVLVAGVIYLDPFRDGLARMRETGLATQAGLVARVIEGDLADAASAELDDADPGRALALLDPAPGSVALVFDAAGRRLAEAAGGAPAATDAASGRGPRTPLIDTLEYLWSSAARLRPADRGGQEAGSLERLVSRSLSAPAGPQFATFRAEEPVFAVAIPVAIDGRALGAVVLMAPADEIDRLARAEREQVLYVLGLAMAISIALSLLLASTIANPLADLAAAAEIGRDRNRRRVRPGRVRIPDLGTRPDEIGRLASALRGMVAALYDRIDANEQFAADVAHEIKNPLASLRSAVGSMRMVVKPEHRERLLDVIEHDVRRLDRLVSDISNASRLDSELVKEEELRFDLIHMLSGLCDFMSREAEEKGVELIADLPDAPMMIEGLESRLAQVFVNLLSNAISFCESGDAIRIWARQRQNRVLVVVEDTGPGIPDAALTKIFNRFYSERPAGQFGNNSGLGLAISKQIVEAHGGVIWAENIEPTDFDPTSDRLGARFVVGLPV